MIRNIPSFNNLNTLLANKLTVDDLQVEVEYLIKDFLVKNALYIFFAKAGQGKSWLMLSLAIKLLQENLIRQCVYLDMDNSKAALKNRRVDELIEKYPDLAYIHSSKIDVSSKNILESLSIEAKQNENCFEGVLFIFDSIRDFLGGSDMNSDRDILPIMAQLKDLREAGATVIFLHHTTKDSDGHQFKGSTSFIDSVDVAYSLTSNRNENILSYQLMVHKDRLSVENTALELDTRTMTLTSENFEFSSLSDNEVNFVKSVQEFLQSVGADGVKQTDLLKAIGKSSDDKTARKYLKNFSGEMWKSQQVAKENNAIYYFAIDLPNTPNLPDQMVA